METPADPNCPNLERVTFILRKAVMETQLATLVTSDAALRPEGGAVCR